MKKILFLLMAVLLIVSCNSKKKDYNEIANTCYTLAVDEAKSINDNAEEYIAILQKAEDIKKLPTTEQEIEREILIERSNKLGGTSDCGSLVHGYELLKDFVAEDTQESYKELGNIVNNLRSLSAYVMSKGFVPQDYQKKYADVQAQIKNFGEKYPDISKAGSKE